VIRRLTTTFIIKFPDIMYGRTTGGKSESHISTLSEECIMSALLKETYFIFESYCAT
jgi:hypothetical protein